MLQVDLQGLPALEQRLARLLAQTGPAVGAALYRAGNDIMGESVRLVPVDTTNLRTTANVTRPEQQGTMIAVQLSYGSHGEAPYAVYVEFDTTVNHPNGGQAHYLSQPFFAAVATLAQQLAQSLRMAWER